MIESCTDCTNSMTTFKICTLLISFFIIFKSLNSVKVPDVSQNEISFHSSVQLTNSGNLSFRFVHPHTYLSTIEIVNKYNYNGEKHHVKTKDGYILELHRINGKQGEETDKRKPAILLMHGILASSSDWVISGPEKGLAFILADAGYDVWMGNARGNVYSRTHVSLSTNSAKFWDFSWHEIGIYDLPAKINYILKTTDNEKIIYIGHSQGTTAFYVMAAERPKFNDKVHIMISLAPIAYLKNMFNPLLKYIARFSFAIDFMLRLFGVREIKPTNEFMKLATSILCNKESQFQTICLNIVFMICGYNHEQMDKSLLPAILSHMPAGSSVKQFIHFSQLVNTLQFRQYDYGYFRNWLKYKARTPPYYKISNIRVPIALFYSHNDWLSHPQDVHSLYTKLENPIGKFKVAFEKFNHLDYLWAKDVKTILYGNLLNLLSNFQNITRSYRQTLLPD